jgi:hypothetical protein
MARSNFEKVLERVNECETEENSFLLGEVDSTLNGDSKSLTWTVHLMA